MRIDDPGSDLFGQLLMLMCAAIAVYTFFADRSIETGVLFFGTLGVLTAYAMKK